MNAPPNQKTAASIRGYYQTFTILSQQNERDIKTFILHNIYKRFPVTVVNDLRKVIS